MALDQIEDKLVGIPWRTCAVCHWMSENGDDWAARLRRLLSNRGVKFRDIADELEKDPDEPTIPSQALSRHANGGCSANEHLR